MDESQRKTLQRDIQKLTLKLRGEGKDKKEIKDAVAKLKRTYKMNKGGNSGKKRSFREREYGSKSNKSDGHTGRRYRNEDPSEDREKRQRREELGKKHDIVIVPIFWKRNEEQMEAVIKSGYELKSKLSVHRLNVWIDQRKSLTPGQKYAYWEHLGVKFRAEIGPQEAEAKTICLSKSTKPGDVAKRWKNIKVEGKDDIHALLQRLKQEGVKFINIETPCNDCAEFDYKQETYSHSNTKMLVEAGSIVPEPEANDSNAKDVKQQEAKPYVGSGDSLDVNYVLE